MTHRQPNKTNLLLDNPLFDLLYANIKARANSNVPKPPSDPRRRLATHRLDVVIFCGKNFPVDFIFGNERFPINFVLATAAKGDQIHPIKSTSTGGMKAGLTVGAAAGSSSSHKDKTGLDVLAGGASSTAGASRAPRADNASDEDVEDEEPPLDSAVIATTFEGRASDERGTLRTQHLWMNFFFTIFGCGKTKKIRVPKQS
jgi:hypothetical protein